jgi:hypothetical protein
MTTHQRTILVTFAGRRDRMELLVKYVNAAIARGLIDEWHVWDFTRDRADAQWLRQLFPVTQVTPSNSLEYFRAPTLLDLQETPQRFRLEVCAPHDVHVGLRRLTGQGASIEIVLGGWNNNVSAIRRFAEPSLISDTASRGEQQPPAVSLATPSLLPEFGFSTVEVETGSDGVRVFADNRIVLEDPQPVGPGSFELLYRTGFGANGEWRLPGFADHPARLFVAGPEVYYPRDAMFYTAAYRYYVAQRDRYQNDILLKCDDDIVYLDLDKLGDFIEFRKNNRQYFLVSASVVNNGVCAHFQQSIGAIPQWMSCELPPGGMCGTLWSSGTKAEAVHNLFLESPAAFKREKSREVIWNERMSINFIALLGEDLIHIPDITPDDEHDLCYGVRKRAKKQNCIHPDFVTAHLSFWKQDSAMNIRRLLEKYQELAAVELAAAA